MTIVTDQFATLARGTQQSQGITDMSFVEIPHPLGMISREEVNAKIDAAFDSIVDAAIHWTPSSENAARQAAPYPARTFKFTGTYADVNDLFARRKWSLSLPIVPPTVDRVKQMLKGTKRDPSEVLWVVPPREGMLTVELVATLGVMAGAKPEHMPLLIAAVEAMADPLATFRGPTTTTAAAVPVFFISGPIIEKLKLNSGTGTAGGENPVTNALGYFVNLVADVVGGSTPPNFDKSTHGTSADLVAMVFTENNEGQVWKSYPETIGFSKKDSVVTFFGAYSGGSNIDHGAKSGQRLLTTIGGGILGMASAASSCFADADEGDSLTNKTPFVFVVLGPEHASLIAGDFPDREKAKDYLREVTAMPYKFYGDGLCIPPEDFGPYDDNTLIPRYKKSKSIEFFVSGGPGKQTQMWIPLPRSVAVSKKVME
ncbi:MAG TPA: thiol-disulfide oxidoreductase [Mailhella massiliensis]|uniref:Thiol-disulfide oxidoreductase n=1 Tax=Mailhella massiliensis TaxID=1903261 RepID=A0A921AY15_9BACT|nr:thiol-disulfide oxidoreductase [Mailhella massiliensis]